MNNVIAQLLDDPPIDPSLLGEVAGTIMLEELERGKHIDSDTALLLARLRILSQQNTEQEGTE